MHNAITKRKINYNNRLLQLNYENLRHFLSVAVTRKVKSRSEGVR